MKNIKCEVCGKEVKNLDLHMKKYHSGTEESDKENKDGELDPRYATKKDIEDVLGAIKDIATSVKESSKIKPVIVEKTVPEIPGTADLSNIKESAKESPVPTETEIMGGTEKAPIPPAWRKLVDELLGMDFGINISYPQTGSGFLFRIIVPEEKSNMSKDYKNFYKVDVRTKAINYNEGIDGVRKFCELVKKNLEQKR
jgi:hypothetical protein